MRKTYSLTRMLLPIVAASFCMSVKAQTPTQVFYDNFDRTTFLTNNSYGTPPTLYKFTVGGTSTINTTLVSGSNYRANINSGSTANRSLFYAPMAPYSSPFSRKINSNVGLVTWTFNMRTSTAVTTTSPAAGAMAGGIDLCGNAAGNIYNGAPTGYGVVFNSSATGGVDLVRFSAGMATNVVLITETTTMPKTDYYSVRVTYNPATNQWSLYTRDDGAAGFADPSSGVVTQQGSTITDATYANNVQVNFGALYTWTAGVGKTMSVDNFRVAVTIPPCAVPGLPTGLSYSNTATTSTVTFTPPGTAPTGYILVSSTGSLVGTPTSGQAVTIGTSVGSNGTIVATGTGSPITASGLTGNTNYTLTLYPYNNTGCTGGPTFNTAVSSTNITTCPNTPALTGAGTPTSNTIPNVTWSAPAAGGGVYTTYNYLLNVYTDPGLTIPATGYPLAGTTVTSPYTITGLASGVTYYYTITAVDTACNSAASAPNSATTSVVPCSGTPSAGAATSTATMVTGSAPFTLGLSGADGSLGITFQWQSSSCDNSWSNISGVTSSYFYPTTENTSTYYRCNVTCTNSGITTPSVPIYIENIVNAYCFPTSTNGCSAGDGVNAFTLAGECGTSINDPGPMVCGATNTDHTGYSPIKMFAGNSYAASVNSNFDGDDVYVWIDFNNSGTFEPSEIVYSTATAPVPSLPFFYSFNIPIPTGANLGTHRMRVVVNNAQVLSTGCDALTFGTSVDYMVQILPNMTLSANSPLCLPGTLTLTANPSIACGAVYTWSGPLGYSNTTINANSVNPPANAGTYNVSVSVNGVSSCPSPAATSVIIYSSPTITGLVGMCVGSTTTLNASPAGGLWASTNSAVATVGSSTGIVTGASIGAANISYTVPSTGCYAISPMNITNFPVVYNVTGGGSYCAGGTGVHVGVSNSGPGVSYQLYVSGLAIGTPITGTGSPIDFGLITIAGTYTVIANPGTSCAVNMNGSVTIAINPLPVIYPLTGGGSYCPGGAGVVVGLGGSDLGVNYQLSQGGILIGGVVPGTLSTLNFGLQTALGNYNVFALNPTTGCSAYMAPTVAVSLKPLPALFSVTGGGSYCPGGTGADVGLGNSVTGVSYTLYRGGVSTGLSLPGTGALLDFGLQTITGVYTVVATDGTTSCSASMLGSATVSVSAAPAAFNVTGGGAYCAGGTGVHVGLSGSVLGISYTLYNGGVAVSAASGTSAPIDFGLQSGAGVYTVIGTNTSTGCAANMSGSVTITINPLPTPYTVTGGGPYCAGGAGVPVGLSNSLTGTNYRLLNGGLPVGAIMPGTGSAINFGTFTSAAVYTVIATTTATGCSGPMTGSVTITVNPLPIPNTVTGGGSYCSGGTGVDIGLNGSNVSYNYQLRDGLTTIGSPVSGTGSPLDFGLQTLIGNYNVVATNISTGCVNNMSGGVPVVINPLPTPHAVLGGGSYCIGGTGVFVGLDNSETGNSYRLYLGGTAVGSPIAGLTGTALSFGLQTVPGVYTVVATNTTTGCTNLMTGSVTVTITSLPTSFTVTGGGSYCSGGAGVHVGLNNSATGINYQLYNGTTVVGTAIPGTGTAIDFGAETLAGTYTVVGTNTTTGCSGPMSGSTTITISSLPAAFAVSGGGGYCPGGAGVHVGLVSSVPGISYQLYNGVSGMGAAITGTGSAIDFGLQTLTGTYTVVGTNTISGCTNSMTGSVVVNVNALPAIYTVTGGGNYCVGGAGVVVGLSGTNAGINYQLYNGTTAVGSPMTGSGPAISFGLQTAAGMYTVQATNTTTGCMNTMTGSATVNITTTPVVYNVTGGGNYCPSGPGVAVGLGGSDPGTNYQLYNGGPVGAAVSGTGSAISFGLQTVPGSYTVVASGGTLTCVANMHGSAIVGLNSLPAVHHVTGGGIYCSGGAGVLVGLDMTDGGINYQLYNGMAVGAPVAGTGGLMSFGLQTAGGNYTVIATDATTGCTNAMAGAAPVVVNPLPATYTVTGGGAYCAGGPGVSVLLNGSAIGINYQLYNGSSMIGSAVPGTGASLDFGPQPAGVYTVSATNPVTGCTNNMTGSVAATMNALPDPYVVSGGGSFCAGGTGVDVQLNGSASGISYQLYNGGSLSGTAMPGTGSAIDFGMQTSSGAYTVIATNIATGCTNTMTGGATVVANPLPTIHTVTGSSLAYCAGGAGVTISLTGSDGGINYQLYHNGIALGSALPGSGSILSFGPQTLAGNYTVVATNNMSGCTVNMSGVAPVAINPVPATYTVTGGGAYCSGGTGVHVGLSGSVSGILYQLYEGTTVVGLPVTGSGGVLDFGLQTVAGNYTAVAANPFTGCTTNMTGSAMVGINPLPALQTVTGGGNYCAGGSGVSVELSGSVIGIRYQLQVGTISVGTPIGGSGTMLNFGNQTTAGIYTVVATNPVTGCSSSMTGSATIVINPLPTAYTVVGGGSYCAGGPGVHVGLGNSDLGISYQLYNGISTIGGGVAGSGLALDMGLQTSSGIYTIVATDNTTGCTNNMSGNTAISINALPSVYTVTGGGSFCAGGTGVHVSLSNSATGVNYTLYSGTAIGTLHGNGGALDFGLQTGAGSYTVTATNAATGCLNNMSGSAMVIVNPAVVPSVVITSPGGNVGCTGHASTFTAMPSNGGAAPVYQWMVNGVVTGGSTNTMSYIPLGGDVVSVTMTSNAMCAAPLSAANNMTMSVNTMEYPSVLMSSDHGHEVCQGTLVTYTAVPSFGGSAPVYTWVTNGVPVAGNTLGTYSYVPSNGDNVYCVLHSNYYCRLSDTQASNTMHMTTDVSLTPVVTIAGSNGGSIAAGIQEVLTATVSNGGPSPAYQWSVNGVAIPGATLTTYTSRAFSNQDKVSCTVTSDGVCSGLTGTGSITIDVWNVGVNPVSSVASEINVLPNPNKGAFTISGSLGSVNDEDISIEMTDLLGHEVYRNNVVAKSGKINERVQLSSALSNGMYILNVHSQSGNKLFHVVIEQ